MESLKSYLQWIDKMTPVTKNAMERHKETSFSNISVAYVAHVEPKMISHLEFFHNKGVELHVAPCVPKIVDKNSFNYLKSIGIKTYGINANKWGELTEEWKCIIAAKPNYIFDIGGGCIASATESNAKVIAACEATTTGIERIKNLNLTFPVFNCNDIPFKDLMHNRYEVGSGIWYAFRKLTQLDICRLNVGVIGFGMVGQSVASTARGLGARVWITDTNNIQQMVGASEGYITTDIENLIKNCEVIVTATGRQNILTKELLQHVKDGVIIANAAHDPREINLEGLSSKGEIIKDIEVFNSHSKDIYLLANGQLLNLAIGGGSAINSFDFMTALIIDVLCFVFKEGKNYDKGLHAPPSNLVDDILSDARALYDL